MTLQEAVKRKIELEQQLAKARAAREAFLAANAKAFAKERDLAAEIHGLVDEVAALHSEHPSVSDVADALSKASAAKASA